MRHAALLAMCAAASWSTDVVRSQQCAWAGSSCMCGAVDVTAFAGKTWETTDAPSSGAESFSYKYTLCGMIPTGDLPSGCTPYADKPTFVKYSAASPQNCIQIGQLQPTAAVVGGNLQLTYTYQYGCKNVVTLSMSCSDSAANPGTVTAQSDSCVYALNWATKGMCGGICGKCSGGGLGGSSGWGLTFLVVFGLVLALYCGAGYTWQYKQSNRGSDAVPNIGFWRALPGLVNDGIVYTVERIKGQAQGYSKVDASAEGKPIKAGKATPEYGSAKE